MDTGHDKARHDRLSGPAPPDQQFLPNDPGVTAPNFSNTFSPQMWQRDFRHLSKKQHSAPNPLDPRRCTGNLCYSQLKNGPIARGRKWACKLSLAGH
jgi:hypothetical protein